MAKVLVVGTGTIGEPLAVLMTKHQKELGIGEVTVTKFSPRPEDRPMVLALQKRGALLAVEPEKRREFLDIGITPDRTVEDARRAADVIVDCTPSKIGRDNRKRHYEELIKAGSLKAAIAQGSERGFGMPYAYGINDEALVSKDRERSPYIQVVSCNTHVLAHLLSVMAGKRLERLRQAAFVLVRRVSDIGQRDKVVISPRVVKHEDAEFGTHQAQDVYRLWDTLGLRPQVVSSAIDVPTQTMHAIHFNLELKGDVTVGEIVERCLGNELVAVTDKDLMGQIFAFGRDHGPHGRILNPLVVQLPSLFVVKRDGGSQVLGWCINPQEGNSLISSLAATCWAVNPGSYQERLASIKGYLFSEV